MLAHRMPKILRELGVRPIINASGTLTALGGSVIHNQVLHAWREASEVFLDMKELHARAGKFIARLVGAETAYVTCGTAASLVMSVAACMTRGETNKMARLPKSEGMRNEVVVQRLHRNEFEHTIELTGARIIEIGDEQTTTRRDLSNAISERTAAVVYFAFDPQQGVLPLEHVLEVSHRQGVSVIVDAAAETPPKENLRRFIEMGADLVLFSAGKDIGAPNDTGIILGRRDLVETCTRLGPHNTESVNARPRDYIGRPMKTSKEDISAVVAALKRYLQTDHGPRLRRMERMVRYMVSALSKHDAVKVKEADPAYDHPRPVCIPRVELEFPSRALGADEVARRLREGEPPIHAYVMNQRLYINPQCLRSGEERIIVSRLGRILSEKRYTNSRH